MMRTILDTMTDGVSVVDATGGVVLRNPAATHAWSATSASTTGESSTSAATTSTTPTASQVTAADSPMVMALSGEPVGPIDVFVRNPVSRRRSAGRGLRPPDRGQ